MGFWIWDLGFFNVLLGAIQFLTILPVGSKDVKEEDLAKTMAFFPLVGLLLGSILCAINWVLSFNLPKPVISVLLITVPIFLTGALHLDGFSDTMDAFFSGKSREEMLQIMRDSRMGVMGFLGLFCLLSLKISLIATFPKDLNQALLLMPILGRWSMVFMAFLSKYAREEGKGKCFIIEMNLSIFLFSTFISLAFSYLISKVIGILTFLIVFMTCWVLVKYSHRKIGGITGDVFGAANGTGEIVSLLVMFMLSL